MEIRTQKQIKESFQHLRDEWKSKGDIDQANQTLLESLFEYHPRWQEKRGVGIKRMWVQRNTPYNTYGFWLERTDGTTTDIGFMQAVKGFTGSNTNGFKEALRRAVDDQILAFRIENNMDETRHADHDPSFESLVQMFVNEHGTSQVIGVDGQIGTKLTNKVYRSKWQDFHREYAKLFNISAKENLTKMKTRLQVSV